MTARLNKLTSKDILEGPIWMQNECAQGYRDGRDKDAVYPSGNRTPAYIHGFNCAWRDNGKLPQIPMHQIIATWNMIVLTESAQ